MANLKRKKKEPRSIRSRYAAVTISIFLSRGKRSDRWRRGAKKKQHGYRSIRNMCVCVRLDARVKKVATKKLDGKKSAII